MKKLTITILLLVGLISSACAEKMEAGVDKIVTQATQTGDKIEVLEFFWYGCPHCYTLEPHMKKWLKTKPDNVEFIRVPAVFSKHFKVHARTYYALEMLGSIETLHPKIFSTIHNRKLRNKLDTLDKMSAFIKKHDVDQEKFLKAYNSFAVETKMRKAIKMMNGYDVKGVPAVAVNGKYYVTGQSAGSYENLIKVVDRLIKKETSSKS